MTEYTQDITLKLEEKSDNSFQLTVFTTDASGSALSNVSVSIEGPTTATKDVGDMAAVTFSDIPTGEYTVRGSKDGYNDAQTTVVVNSDNATAS